MALVVFPVTAIGFALFAGFIALLADSNTKQGQSAGAVSTVLFLSIGVEVVISTIGLLVLAKRSNFIDFDTTAVSLAIVWIFAVISLVTWAL